MTPSSIPDELRKRIEKDWRPVRPLPPPWLRTLPIVALTMVVAAVVLATASPNASAPGFPLWLSWGGSLVELGFGIVMIGQALRESIPGQRQASGAIILLLVGGVVIQGLLGLATWLQSSESGWLTGVLEHGVGCLVHDTMLALPTLAITMYLVLRALPTRAPFAGVIGGAGAGLTADAIAHLQCPIADVRHVVIWHTGALLAIMLAGWIIGTAWQHRR